MAFWPRAERSETLTAQSRFENKYIVNPALVPALRQFVLSVASPDPFAHGAGEPRYAICSLYLDTPDLSFYRQSLRGDKSRFKLRVRAYSDDPGAPVFLEVKARVDRVIHKRRVRLARQHAVAVLNRRIRWWDLFVPGAARGDLDQFASRVALSRCEPLVRIRYDREAYVACPPEPVRLTFDTNLCFQPTFGPDLSLTTGRWSPVPIGGVILEIKFSGAGPSWIGHMVRCFGLQRVPCCKFARAVTCMQRADPARMAARRLGAPNLAA